MNTAARSVASSEKRAFLRHVLATLAYRGGKAIRGVPEGFAEFRACESSRTPAQILAHIGDLFDWAFVMGSEGRHEWHDSVPLNWEDEVRRFFAKLQKFDDFLASAEPLLFSEEALFQGPVADALTHVGQIAMLRRMAGSPIKGENYLRAEIVSGRVGTDQAAPRREFD